MSLWLILFVVFLFSWQIHRNWVEIKLWNFNDFSVFFSNLNKVPIIITRSAHSHGFTCIENVNRQCVNIRRNQLLLLYFDTTHETRTVFFSFLQRLSLGTNLSNVRFGAHAGRKNRCWLRDGGLDRRRRCHWKQTHHVFRRHSFFIHQIKCHKLGQD